jgi:hypothetical protein
MVKHFCYADSNQTGCSQEAACESDYADRLYLRIIDKHVRIFVPYCPFCSFKSSHLVPKDPTHVSCTDGSDLEEKVSLADISHVYLSHRQLDFLSPVPLSVMIILNDGQVRYAVEEYNMQEIYFMFRKFLSIEALKRCKEHLGDTDLEEKPLFHVCPFVEYY